MDTFYDDLSGLYHLIYQDWEASIRRQGKQLAALIESKWPSAKTLLDVSCGIGTQALGLAMQGYTVKGSDLSDGAIARAQKEATARNLEIDFSVCDMREVHSHYGSGFDMVLSADNSIPHLLSNDEILNALRQMHQCIVPGGGCIITVRDYAVEKRGTHLMKPYGVRVENGRRYIVFQVWDFEGEIYNLSFFFVEENLATGEVVTHTMRTSYYAVSIDTLCDLMRRAGFVEVSRVDGAFYQPVLVGTKSKS